MYRACPEKNRYRDMVPFADNRVKLADGSYINASYMCNFDRSNPKSFIACQGPLQSTITDQWNMLVNEQVRSVLTIGTLAEGTTEKIAQYWPENPGDSLSVENMSITCIEKNETYAGLIQRDLQVSLPNGTKETLVHYHFYAWPDHGSLPPEKMILLARVVKTQRELSGSSPIVVHCSAGVGRTGSVLALFSCVESVESQLRTNGGQISDCWLSVMTNVLNLRECRVHIVERTWQYESLYAAIAELVNRHTDKSCELVSLL
jgi:protein tyrosine phosphatase